ncbi:hypothetical protein TNCV_4491471 [Trichonephila clavipes]|nr:hypothetical protein TNCV_4491471 [Trichonephila clavipes]
MLQTDAWLISKSTSFHSATHILLSSHHWRQKRGSASRVNQATDVLRTDHSPVNGVECYAHALNDALQTQWWCTEVDAIDHVGPSYPPATNGHISALQLFGFVQHDYLFP